MSLRPGVLPFQWLSRATADGWIASPTQAVEDVNCNQRASTSASGQWRIVSAVASCPDVNRWSIS
jgi:hypothetical protein